jgi:hypothetical protein
MAIVGIQTINDIWIISVDANPIISGLTAPNGSFAIMNDGSGVFQKSGTQSTSWNKSSVFPVVLSTDVVGVLPISNGGSGTSSQSGGFNNLSPLTTKGDLITYNGTDNIRFNSGTNNQILISDSTQTSGLTWSLVNDINTTIFTTTKISTLSKSLLNSNIVYSDQSNIFGTFSQVFKSSNISIRNPNDTFGYTIIGSGITASYNLILPLISSDDTLVGSSAIQSLLNKTGYNGLVITANTGVITTGTWNATVIGANYGGTGQITYTIGDILYADTTSSLAKLSDVASGSYLRSGGVGIAPSWSLLTLPNTSTTGDLLFSSATNSVSNLVDVVTGNVLLSGGVGVVPSYGKVGLTTHVSGILLGANGGTGVANTGLTITLGGNLITTGTFSTTFAQQFSGVVTLPNATSTLATLSLAESLLNKTGYNGLVITANTGIITTGTWNAGIITGQYGGTGVANTGLTITLGGNLITTGLFNTTFTQQFSGVITLPNATSTLATTSLSESLLNKTGYNGLVITANTGIVTTGTWNAGIITGQYGGTGVVNTGLTITLGGNLATTGAFNTTFLQQFSGVVTLPNATSTLATLSLSESLINKTGYNGLVITANTGIVTTGTWNATVIGANYGGTGQTTYVVGDILFANTTTSLSRLADVASGSYLRSGGIGVAPSWSSLTLPNTSTTGDLLFSSATNTVTNLSDVATGNVLLSGGVGVVPSYGKVGLTTHVSGILPSLNGGTGVANTGLITIGGNFTTTGAFNTSFTQQFSGVITLPNATSTLATLSLVESLLNKTGYNGLVVTANTGVITTGTWNGTGIAAIFGGTDQTSYVVGDILYASTTTNLSRLADVASGSYLRSGGVGVAPSWSLLTLPNSSITGDLLISSATNSVTNLSDVATGNVLLSGGVGIVPSYGKVGLTTHVSGILPSLNGGTGVANTGLITLGGNFTTTGAFNTSFTQQGSFTYTLPNATSLLLANNLGISGGSTLIGGILASDTLTLKSTSNATLGKILFGTSAYDEVNNRLGIQQVVPTAGIDLPAATSTVASLRIRNGVTVSTPNDGDVWYGAQKAFRVYMNSVTQSLSGSIFTQTNTQTITNTITETTLIGTGVGTTTIPANFFISGKTMRIRIYGTILNNGARSITLKVKLGTTVITSSAVSQAGSTSSFSFDDVITCRTSGATGTVMSQGVYKNNGTGTVVDLVSSAPVTVDTTISQLLDVTLIWSIAGVNNTISSTNTIIEIIN